MVMKAYKGHIPTDKSYILIYPNFWGLLPHGDTYQLDLQNRWDPFGKIGSRDQLGTPNPQLSQLQWEKKNMTKFDQNPDDGLV